MAISHRKALFELLVTKVDVNVLRERGKIMSGTNWHKSDTKVQQYDQFIKHLLNKYNTNMQKRDVFGHSTGSNLLPCLIHTQFVLHSHTLCLSA